MLLNPYWRSWLDKWVLMPLKWVLEKTKRLLSYVPIVQCLVYFSFDNHRVASKKLVVLLLLTSLPILVAAAMGKIPDGDELDAQSKFFKKLKEFVNGTELFVYAASFLSPILYLVYERYRDATDEKIGERISVGIRGVFNGHWLIALLSLLTLLFTAIGFSSVKGEATNFHSSFLHYFLTQYAFEIYLFSLYCWYLALLAEEGGGDFVTASRASENELLTGFTKRVENQVGQN